jgi:dihydropyrimidinase
MVSRNRFDLTRFVAWTATEPAKIYGLYPRKGSIAVGSDADVAIWDPRKSVIFSDATVTDRSGYTPWAGRAVEGWPVVVLRRGEVIVEDGRVAASPGSGQFLARAGGFAALPLGRRTPEFDLSTNFQTVL